jgi:hypothetical protein
MHYELMFPSNYLRCSDLMGKDVKVTIEKVSAEPLVLRGGKQQQKATIRFVGKKKALVLCRTSADVIAEAYGKQVEAWVGKEITLYGTTTKLKGKTVDCIRVREMVQPATETNESQV